MMMKIKHCFKFRKIIKSIAYEESEEKEKSKHNYRGNIQDNPFYNYYDIEKWDVEVESRTVDVADWFSQWYWYTFKYKDSRGLHIIKTINGGYDTYTIDERDFKLEGQARLDMIQYGNYLIENYQNSEKKELEKKQKKEIQQQMENMEFLKHMLESKNYKFENSLEKIDRMIEDFNEYKKKEGLE